MKNKVYIISWISGGVPGRTTETTKTEAMKAVSEMMNDGVREIRIAIVNRTNP